MPLPANFPKPPRQPPSSVPLTHEAWRDYHRDLRDWLVKLMAAIP